MVTTRIQSVFTLDLSHVSTELVSWEFLWCQALNTNLFACHRLLWWCHSDCQATRPTI
jgi:hypothetical protein